VVWPINEKGSLCAGPSYVAKQRQVNVLLAKLTSTGHPSDLWEVPADLSTPEGRERL